MEETQSGDDAVRGSGFTSALRDLMAVIRTDHPGMVIGGMAVIALGYPRATTDIDVAILVRSLGEIDPLFARLQAAGLAPRINDAVGFARANHVLLMRHSASHIDVDISLATLQFEEEAVTHRQFVDFAGVPIAVPRLEDLLIYKMVASRPQDLRDVEELLLRHVGRINIGKVRDRVGQFASLLERPDMITQMEGCIQRAAR